MPTVDVICWANSRKHSGRCVAGTRIDGGGWVRPVGPGEEGILRPRDYRLNDGTEARVLDLIRIELSEPRPEPHQPENWLVGHRPWRLLARPAPRDLILSALRSHLIGGPALFGNELDRVPFSRFAEQSAVASLALVMPSDLRWLIRVPSPGKLQIRAVFALAGKEYRLSVTDPTSERTLGQLPEGYPPAQAIGMHADDQVVLIISLGEPFAVDDCCYKLVAAVYALAPSVAAEVVGR